MSNINQHKINDLLKKAKLKFFKRDCEFTLFGIMAYKYIWDVTNLPDDIEGMVMFDLKEENPEKNVDKILLNQSILSEKDYTHDNLIGLVIHELLHILHRHGIQSIDKQHKELWNLACDHIIDRDCKKMNVDFYQNRFNIVPELNNELPNCSVIEAYNWLVSKANTFSIKVKQDSNGNIDIDSIEITNEKTGKKYTVNAVPADAKDKNDKEKNKLIEITNQFVNEARAVNNILNEKNKLRGTNSGNTVVEYLNQLLEVKIDWNELLEKAIKTNIIMKPNNRSWKKLNIYYRPHGINLPGNSMDEEENIGLLVIWLDISGSIDKKELKKFAYVTGESLKYFERVLVLVHNTNIVQELEFSKEEKVKYYDFIISTGFKTGGGTSHKCCYEYVKDEIWNSSNNLKDDLSMIISLTDGHSDIRNCYDKYDWCKSVPTVFICTSNKKFEDETKNMMTINIKD
jgi:predicted metal-dependent peptidase